MDRPRWYRTPEALSIALILLALALVWTCTGCRAGSPGVRVTAGAFGVEVSVQVGGGDLAPRVTTETPPPTPAPVTPATDATPPTPGPKDEEGKGEPGGGG